MKKIIMTGLIALGALGLTTATLQAKCGGDNKPVTKPVADGNSTKGKCSAGKCGAGKCGGK